MVHRPSRREWGPTSLGDSTRSGPGPVGWAVRSREVEVPLGGRGRDATHTPHLDRRKSAPGTRWSLGPVVFSAGTPHPNPTCLGLRHLLSPERHPTSTSSLRREGRSCGVPSFLPEVPGRASCPTLCRADPLRPDRVPTPTDPPLVSPTTTLNLYPFSRTLDGQHPSSSKGPPRTRFVDVRTLGLGVYEESQNSRHTTSAFPIRPPSPVPLDPTSVRVLRLTGKGGRERRSLWTSLRCSVRTPIKTLVKYGSFTLLLDKTEGSSCPGEAVGTTSESLSRTCRVGPTPEETQGIPNWRTDSLKHRYPHHPRVTAFTQGPRQGPPVSSP